MYNGACKVTVEDPPGTLRDQGSGFLFRFQIEEADLCYGLLTCHHVVARAQQDERSIPDPTKIFIEFKSEFGYKERLSDIQKENAQPLISAGNDIYFQELSEEFRIEMETSKIGFYESLETILDQHVWIAQYPNNGDRHIAAAKMECQAWLEKRRHSVSTRPGSSGAPLLQLHNGEMKVIGMHQGALIEDQPQNQASRITAIIKILYDILLGLSVKIVPEESDTRVGKFICCDHENPELILTNILFKCFAMFVKSQQRYPEASKTINMKAQISDR